MRLLDVDRCLADGVRTKLDLLPIFPNRRSRIHLDEESARLVSCTMRHGDGAKDFTY